MGNIHNSVEVATLVPQGDLMPFHHYSTIGLVVLAFPSPCLSTTLGMDLAPMLPCVINMFNQAISLSLLLIFLQSLHG
jgi:hypothetical protein